MTLEQQMIIIDQLIYTQPEMTSYDYFNELNQQAKKSEQTIYQSLYTYALGSVYHRARLFQNALEQYQISLELVGSVPKHSFKESLQLWIQIAISFLYCDLNKLDQVDELQKQFLTHPNINNSFYHYHNLLLDITKHIHRKEWDIVSSNITTVLETGCSDYYLSSDFYRFKLIFMSMMMRKEQQKACQTLNVLYAILNKKYSLQSAYQLSELTVIYAKKYQKEDGINRAYANYFDLATQMLRYFERVKIRSIELKEILFSQKQDMIAYEEKKKKLLTRANTDALTRLANRFSLSEYLTSLIQKNALKHSIGIILFDIDNFKYYNDTLGHLYGDLALKEIGKILKSSLSNYFPARYAGDEFLVICDNTTIPVLKKKAEQIKNKIHRSSVIQQLKSSGHEFTVSQGIVCFIPSPSTIWEDYLRCADYALYKGKETGKNNITIYGQDIINESWNYLTELKGATYESFTAYSDPID